MKKIISLLLAFVITGSIWFPFLTDATVLPIASATYTLSGAGVSSTATSFTLSSFTLPQTGYEIVDSDLSDTFYVTFEPGKSRQEIASCTTVSQNSSNTTATISGCTRGLYPITPFTTSASYKLAHGGGTQVVFSDPPQFLNQYAAKENNEAITGDWTVPTPAGGTSVVNKNYVLSVVTGGTITTNQLVVSATAGETVSAGQVVYLKQTDARWYKAATTIAEASSTLLGIAEGSGTAGVAITGGVLLHGQDTNQSGLTAGKNYFLSSTAGAVSTGTTTRSVGRAQTATALYFDTWSVNQPQLISNNSWSGNNTFTATTSFTNIATTTGTATTTVGNPPVNILDISKNVQIFTTDGTFTVPAGVKVFHVQVLGAGEGGLSASGAVAQAGGGAGGFTEGWFDLSGTTTINVKIGAAGTTNGGDGGITYFGSIATSTGGAGGSGGIGFATTSSITLSAINMRGAPGIPASASGISGNPAFAGGLGGNTKYGSPGGGQTTDPTTGGYGYGYGGTAAGEVSGTGQAGGPGLVRIDW